MRIAFYSPDRHITYDGSTPDLVGVGGGITVRIRLAAALAARGHEVQVVCNCAAPIRYENVAYSPVDSVHTLRADALIAHSTGGAMDLSPLLQVDLEARLRVLALSGVPEPKAWEEFHPHVVTGPSDFITGAIRAAWKTRPDRVFSCPYGFRPDVPVEWSERDLRSIIYSNHPSKGLGVAMAVVRLLRDDDPAWNLHVYGGNRLWGGADEPVDEPGVVYHGMIPQPVLRGLYPRFGFALHLQRRPEPYALTLVEGMAAGCVPVASPAGAYSEVIRSGLNGFLVDGDPETESVQRTAAGLMRELASSKADFARIREGARSTPFSWGTVAHAWETWLQWELGGRTEAGLDCPECRRNLLRTPVGLHCTTCGTYRQTAAEASREQDAKDL
jgi:glycosyltransferase involved in cell wall biosynthesis